MKNKHSDYIPEGIKLLIIVTSINSSHKLIQSLNKRGVYYCNYVRGKGTANKEVLDFLGIGETEKDLIFALVDEKIIPDVFKFLSSKQDYVGRSKGIAFTISLDSIASMKAIREICRI